MRVSGLGELPLQAAKTPPRITRDGLFKAIEIGGLTDEDLIGLIKDCGVDFQCAVEDERKLAAAKIGAKVVEALRANYRIAPVKPAPAASDVKTDPAPEADEIVAGTQLSPAVVQAPAVEAGEIVAGGARPGQAPAVEAEEIVAGGPKPPQAPAVEPEVVAGGPQPKTSPAVEEEEVVAGGPEALSSNKQVGPLPDGRGSEPVSEPRASASGLDRQGYFVTAPKPPPAPAVESETVAGGPRPALAPPPPAPAPEPPIIAAPQDIPAAATPVVSAPSGLPQQIAAAARAPQEFIPATPQRKVFPSVPSGLAPFVKGTHVVKVRVPIDERGAVQAAHVLSMTGEAQRDSGADCHAERAEVAVPTGPSGWQSGFERAGVAIRALDGAIQREALSRARSISASSCSVFSTSRSTTIEYSAGLPCRSLWKKIF